LEEPAKAQLLQTSLSRQWAFARTQFVRNANVAGLSIDSLETTVTGSSDRRGLFEIDNVLPFFNAITIETKVATRDPVERVVQVAKETHRRCPVHATLARATDLTFKLIVNGHSVQIWVYEYLVSGSGDLS
jgi:OsmC-like protein